MPPASDGGDRDRERSEKHSDYDPAFGFGGSDFGSTDLGLGSEDFGPLNIENKEIESVNDGNKEPGDENVEAVEGEEGEEENVYFERGNFGVLDELDENGRIDWIRRSVLNWNHIDCLKKFNGQESWLNDNVIMNYLILELPKINEKVIIVEIDLWHSGFAFPEDMTGLMFPEYRDDWEYVIFPIFVNENHWTLAIADSKGRVEFYDSYRRKSLSGQLGERQKGIIKGVMTLLLPELSIEFFEIDTDTYYQQNNEHSCGPAVCMLAERRLKNEDLKFVQGTVNNWRRHAEKILRNEITKRWGPDIEEENIEEENIDEEEEETVVIPKTRKRKKAPLTLKGIKLKNRESLKKHRDSLTTEQKDAARDKNTERMRKTRANEDYKEKEAEAKMKKRNAERKKGLETTAFLARTPIENENKVPYFDIGDLTDECKHCGARYFEGERKSGNPKGKYNECCNSGNIKLDNAFENYPEKLYYLFAKDHELKPDGTKTEERRKGKPKMFWVLFHEKIRNNNSAFAFASMSADQDVGAMPTYKIHGQVYHTVNMAAIPDPGEKPSYAQLFIVDSKEALDYRMEHKANKGCDRDLLEAINEILNEVGNPYIESFKIMAEVMQEQKEEAELNGTEVPEIKLVFDINTDKLDMRRYNIPRTNEVAAVFVVGDGDEAVPPAVGLRIHERGKDLQTLSKFEKRAESMLYPLYFPLGTGGIGVNTFCDVLTKNRKKEIMKVTFAMYYRYMTAIRKCKALERNQERFERIKEMAYDQKFRERKKDPIRAYEWNKDPETLDLEGFSPIRLGGKLYQHYLVDAYVKIEQDKLDYIRFHQNELKVENYKALQDYVTTTADKLGKNVGRTIILPSSFKGGMRSSVQGYQDSMGLVRRFGKPSLFITFTCNPKWPEIKRNLLPGNNAYDEPDLIDRVFDLKLKEKLKDLKKRQIFGKVLAYTYVVEFQKRGLPHAHILLILDKLSKIHDPEDVDDCVWAEIPDPEKYPRLWETVTSRMVHGPCGALNMNCSCMGEKKGQKGKIVCTKDYPKKFKENTEMGNDSYALYRRRDNGRSFETEKGVVMDNRWIVPYNAYLCLKYDAHINVEICASVKCVKYMYKYVYKGHDKTKMTMTVKGKKKREKKDKKDKKDFSHDEIEKYLDARYVTPHEAFWRIFELKLDDKSHAVTRLDLHLPDQQAIYYKPGEDVKKRLQAAGTKHTKLTAWFELNKVDADAKEYYYYQIPEFYTFKEQKGGNNMIWGIKGGEKRKKTAKPCIGRMYSAHPKQGELFYLRMLLLHVKGAESWKDLLTVDGVEYDNFKEAAKALGLFETDDEIKKYFEEAIDFASAKQLRELFVSLINHGEEFDVKEFWESYKESMAEDFMHEFNDVEKAENLAKADIERLMQINGMTLATYGIELPTIDLNDVVTWNKEEELAKGMEMSKMMNDRQKKTVDYVGKKILEMRFGKLTNGCVFMDGPGGSGKTFVIETLCYLFRGNEIEYKTSSWMGIAANLLPDGRTMHKNFGLPFQCKKDGSSNAKPNNKIGRELIKTDVIIIDEISMVPKHALDIIDRKLRELMNIDLPFGGKIMIVAGDFRQVLPIERRAGRGDLINLSVTKSSLWNFFKIFKLIENKRAAQEEKKDEEEKKGEEEMEGEEEKDEEEKKEENFAEFVLSVGNGEVDMDEDEYMEVPERIISNGDLIEEVFGEFIRDNDLVGMPNRVILTTTNERVHEINEKVLEMIDDQDMKVYYSVDIADKEQPENHMDYPPEFLHEIKESGLPPHELKLKVDCPVMLKRNLNQAAGLCNGTRLRVKVMHRSCIECEFMFGPRTGERVLIPRITVTSAEGILPFKLYRRQIPVVLCFGMTINKSQGQTIDFVGLDMEKDVFSHGVTYVAVSRVKSWNNLKIKVNPDVKGNKIKNIVWEEALLDEEEEDNAIEMKMKDLYGELSGKVVEIESEGVDRYWFSDKNMEVDDKTQKLGYDPNENGLEPADLYSTLDVEMGTEDLFGGYDENMEVDVQEIAPIENLDVEMIDLSGLE
jgi:hypothetical protein